MTGWSERLDSESDILHRQAVRIPLPDVEAERSFHENMMRIAAAGDRKSRLLDDPDVPLTEVYEDELDEMRQSFEHRLQQVAGEHYYDVATAYLDGERDDWIGALAAYYLECYREQGEYLRLEAQDESDNSDTFHRRWHNLSFQTILSRIKNCHTTIRSGRNGADSERPSEAVFPPPNETISETPTR